MASVHLLVLIHGMWGNPGHLAELHRIINETHLSPSSGVQLEVLRAETNRENSTYDGMDWGGERVAQEVLDRVDEIEKGGRVVSKLSVTGYSLGGLIARYVVGILHQKHFFDKVTPVNFNTIATPHLGLPRYKSFASTVTSFLGPKLLSRTGEQFYLVDRWSAKGRPLLEVMADPDGLFYEALSRFQHIRIYANALHDLAVPYVTAAIQTEDPFASYETNGIEIELDPKYSPLIKSYSVPEFPPAQPPRPIIFSPKWFRNRKSSRPLLPPPLQYRFPFNIAVYSLLPLLVPMVISLVFVRFALATRSSRARIRLMEEDETKDEKLVNILAKLESEVESALVDLIIDDPGDTPTSNVQAVTSSAPPHRSNTTQLANSTEESSPALSSSSSSISRGNGEKASREQPVLTPLQKKIAGWLNQLPLQKEMAYFPDVRTSHAMIVSRDVKRFEAHRRGEGIIRHWATSFIL